MRSGGCFGRWHLPSLRPQSACGSSTDSKTTYRSTNEFPRPFTFPTSGKRSQEHLLRRLAESHSDGDRHRPVGSNDARIFGGVGTCTAATASLGPLVSCAAELR